MRRSTRTGDTITAFLGFPLEALPTAGDRRDVLAAFLDSCADCPADFDGDGDVDTADLLILLGAWGTSGPDGDVDGDGDVDTADLLALLGAWGES